MMRQRTELRAPRPVRPASAALSKMPSRTWSLPPQRNFVAIERNLRVPMSDGTVLLADHHLPITELHVTRDNPNADLFVRLCDVDPPGDARSRSRSVCDGIVRLTTHYSIQSPSELVISQATRKETGKEAAHA